MPEQIDTTDTEQSGKEVANQLDKVDLLELVSASKDVQIAQLAVRILQQDLAAAQKHSTDVQQKARELEQSMRSKYGMKPADKFTPEGSIVRGSS